MGGFVNTYLVAVVICIPVGISGANPDFTPAELADTFVHVHFYQEGILLAMIVGNSNHREDFSSADEKQDGTRDLLVKSQQEHGEWRRETQSSDCPMVAIQQAKIILTVIIFLFH